MARNLRALTSLADQSSAGWSAPIYKHYTISLLREYDQAKKPKCLTFVFKCVHKNPQHKPVKRGRLDTSSGTHNLNSTAASCCKKLGKTLEAKAQPVQQTLSDPTFKYDKHTHRAIIALR